MKLHDCERMARGIKAFDGARHDIHLDASGNLATVSGQAEVEDRVNASVLLRRGEDIWNVRFGIDYEAFNSLSSLDQSFLSSSIIAHILTLSGVSGASIETEEFESSIRQLKLRIRVETNSGSFSTEAIV